MRNLGLGFALVVAVGCSNNNTVDDMGLPDLAVGDMASGPDMAIPAMLSGTKVISGKAQVVGVNVDGYIVYFPGGPGIDAVKLDGTDPGVKIAGANWVNLSNKVVFGWVVPTPDTGFGQLWAWKQGVTAVKVSDASVHPDGTATPRLLDGAVANTDGSRILFSTNGAGTTTDVVLANFDGSSPMPILTGIDVSGACELNLGFAGGKFIVGHCTANAADDGGIAASTITAVDAANGTQTTLFSNARNFFAVDSAATKVAGIGVDQQLHWVGIAGGTPVNVANGIVKGELVALNAAGSNLVWITDSDQLMRLDVSIAAQVPVQLQTGVQRLLRISPDDSHAFVAKTIDNTTDPAFETTDVYLVSLTAATTATGLVTTPTGAIFGDAFSLDSTQAYYYTNCAAGSGTLHSQPVAGGADVVIGSNVWDEYAAANNKIVFSDNFRMGSSLVDIKYVPASGGTPSVLATNITDDSTASIRPRLAVNGTKLLYNYSGRPASVAGVYVYDLP